MYKFTAEQFLPIDVKSAWSFFSSPQNLALICPPEMEFKILTSLTGEEIYDGMTIDYRVRPLLGIPMHWRTEIMNVQTQKAFTDRQLKGPYAVWEHTHTFTPKEGGVLMHDVINYQIPYGILGTFAHSLVIRKKIENIFTYRKKILTDLFK
jgi:ligand-binding SRPBCC domain-containing protein